MNSPLPHELERTIVIKARRETVFGYFTDSARWAALWGSGSTIDARPGGAIFIRYPNGVEVGGAVVEVSPPARIVFTYGYASGQPFAVGASRISIELEAVAEGTRLWLTHAMADEGARDQHVQGWRYQLAVFCNAVSDAAAEGATELVDAWFAAWSSPDADRRRALLEPIVAPGVRFGDRFGLIEGLDELLIHVGAIHTFMPGTAVRREGPVVHCQGTLLADWSGEGKDPRSNARGSNVFELDADGRAARVTGFWRGA
jgi:uncharacterized protein YndB with AHSA1/START domain